MGYSSLPSCNFLAQIVRGSGSESPCNLLLGSLVTLSSFLEHFLMFWLRKMLHAHPALSLPQPKNQPVLQGDLVLFRGEWLRHTLLQLRGKERMCTGIIFFFFPSQSVIISPNALIFPMVFLSIYYILDVDSTEMNETWNLLSSCSQPSGRNRPVNV